jgi:hypothetical protein
MLRGYPRQPERLRVTHVVRLNLRLVKRAKYEILAMLVCGEWGAEFAPSFLRLSAAVTQEISSCQ